MRVSLSGATGCDGLLVEGRTYPASERLEVYLADPAIGGSDAEGPRTIHIQWRDLAGNWSTPITIDAWATEPARPPTPADPYA